MERVYLIQCISFSSDIYSEEHIDTRQAFLSKSDAETFILQNNLFDKYEDVSVVPVPIKTEK